MLLEKTTFESLQKTNFNNPVVRLLKWGERGE